MSNPCPKCAAEALRHMRKLCDKARVNIGYSAYAKYMTEIRNLSYGITDLTEEHTRGVDENGHIMIHLKYTCSKCDFNKMLRFKDCELTTNDTNEPAEEPVADPTDPVEEPVPATAE